MKTLLLFSSLVFIFSCCQNFHIEKRTYRKGYYVQWTKKEKSSGENSIKDLKEELYLDSKEHSKSDREDQTNNVVNSKDSISYADQGKIIEGNTDAIAMSIVVTNEPVKCEIQSNIQKDENSEKLKTASKEEKKGNYGFLYFLLLLILPFGMRGKIPDKIANWAKENKTKARLALVASGIIGIVASTLLGSIIRFTVSPWMIVFPAAGLIISLILYFRGKTGSDKEQRRFNTRMSFGIINVSSIFGAFSFGANGFLGKIEKLTNWNFASGISSITERTQDDPLIIHPVVAILLSILLLAALVGALYLLAILSCTLACNGMAALSLLVFFGGGIAVTFLFSLGIVNVFRRESEREANLILRALLVTGITIIFLVFVTGFIVDNF